MYVSSPTFVIAGGVWVYHLLALVVEGMMRSPFMSYMIVCMQPIYGFILVHLTKFLISFLLIVRTRFLTTSKAMELEHTLVCGKLLS